MASFQFFLGLFSSLLIILIFLWFVTGFNPTKWLKDHTGLRGSQRREELRYSRQRIKELREYRKNHPYEHITEIPEGYAERYAASIPDDFYNR